uniref:glycosyltransferase n=1 Tax=Hungatella sp. TaxID=2613924 RepID=UPI002A83BF4C
AGKVFIMHNAIDCEKFRFRPEVRERLRKEMGLEGKFVIGHVGRFERQKNHEFLIEVFAECKKEIDSCILLLIGEGSLRAKIEKKVVEKGLKNSIIFLTKRNDMEYLYQVMDLFVLPSLYEGLPVSCLEAQVNGLECIVSRTVTDELKKQTIGSIITMLPLEKKVWKQNIVSCKIRQTSISQHINDDNYDINLQSCRLHSFYTGKNE